MISLLPRRVLGLTALTGGFCAALAYPALAQTAARPAATTAAPATARPAVTRPATATVRPAAPARSAQVAQPIPRATFIINMDAEYRRLDADRNGAVTRAEIEASERQNFQRQAMARNQALFRQLDADRNGQLSAVEFARLASTTPPPANGVAMLGRFDTNRDGKVTLVEYRASTLVNFDRLDTDKDGIVTPAEMRAGGIGR